MDPQHGCGLHIAVISAAPLAADLRSLHPVSLLSKPCTHSFDADRLLSSPPLVDLAYGQCSAYWCRQENHCLGDKQFLRLDTQVFLSLPKCKLSSAVMRTMLN